MVVSFISIGSELFFSEEDRGRGGQRKGDWRRDNRKEKTEYRLQEKGGLFYSMRF